MAAHIFHQDLEQHAESYNEGFAAALEQVEEVAYAAWNGLDGYPQNPFDGRTRQGLAWSDGARHVFKAVYDLRRAALGLSEDDQ